MIEYQFLREINTIEGGEIQKSVIGLLSRRENTQEVNNLKSGIFLPTIRHY